MEKGLTKNQIIAELTRSSHGKLEQYVPVVLGAAQENPEFMAHLICWNKLKGQVRDSQIALPLASLYVKSFPDELVENSLAHLALLGPRELLRAWHFALDIRDKKWAAPAGRMATLKRLISGWLLSKERNWPKWERTLLQHRGTIRELYCLLHAKPQDWRTQAIVFGRTAKGQPLMLPPNSIFDRMRALPNMQAQEAAGFIIENKIPFLVAKGALGKKASDPDVVLALIQRMTATELVTNTKALERLGIKTNPALRGAFEAALVTAQSNKANVLKTSEAADAIEDEDLKQKMQGLQDRQLQNMGVEGNWLVLGDKSGSMKVAIETAKEVAGTLAKMVKGQVWLVFFDTAPQSIDVTGMPLDAIKHVTRYVGAGGGTSIGCGLLRMAELNHEVDGIAVVSDGGENIAPAFAPTYKAYCQRFDKQIPVYFYKVKGTDPDYFTGSMRAAQHDLQTFDLTEHTLDYYSLPNLVATMRTNRYSLVDEIMATKLLKLGDVYKTPELASV